MDGTFVAELAARMQEPTHPFEADGDTRLHDVVGLPPNWTLTRAPLRGLAATLDIATLDGLRDFVQHNVDSLTLDKLLLQVESPGEVALVSNLDDDQRRTTFVRATYEVAEPAPRLGRRIHDERLESPFEFGTWLDVESVIIALQSVFVDNPDRARLLGLLGTITAKAELTQADDGVSQTVTTQQGATLAQRTGVTNPFRLAPRRTFSEVTQPESPFILRLKPGPSGGGVGVMLIEADGGAWKREAITSVAEWLRANVEGVKVIR